MSNADKEYRADVLVVGAGPVGLTLAGELARHGVRPRIIDRLAKPSPYCRAIGVSPRTLEVWDDMGIARDMIDAGIWIDGRRSIVNGQTHDDLIDLSDLPYATLGLPQYETERLLTRHLSGFGVEIERGVSLDCLAQSGGRVQTVLASSAGGREEATFRYVVGCDGAHSAVRRALGIAFEGSGMPYEFMLGDVHIAWNVPRGLFARLIRPAPNGPPTMFIAVPLPELGRYRVTIIAPPEIASRSGESSGGSEHGIQSERPAPGIEHLQSVADDLSPEKAVLSDIRWSSIFRISMRLAANYRRGNVFIAGDAAHIHPPTGGQGMNTGIQDAYNLAWKLALVQNQRAPETLLDSYEAERRPVGVDVLARTTAATMNLRRGTSGDEWLADTQILVSYKGTPWIENTPPGRSESLGPIAGDRAPDCQGLRRRGFGFPMRLFDVLRGTEHVLVVCCAGPDATAHLSDLAALAAEIGLHGLVRFAVIVEADAKVTELPKLPIYEDAEGDFGKAYGSKPTAMLIRPDGHLAWRGDSWRDAGLRRQLDRTFSTSAIHLTKK